MSTEIKNKASDGEVRPINALVSCTDTPKQAHKRLASLLFEKGERFPKRHGSWIRFRLKGDYFL